jgi:hypothetical protein
MKRSRRILLTLTGISLGVTGCRREPPPLLNTGVLPPERLSNSEQEALPAFRSDHLPDFARPPINAYDPALGYYHAECQAWFPYPYNHYQNGWGYYRCGHWFAQRGSTLVSGIRFSPGEGAISPPPAGAPLHRGIPHQDALAVRSGETRRGGFGRSWFSGST